MSRSPHSARIARAVTLLIVGGALALRWLHLDAESLWYDEGYTAWISGCPPGQIVRTLTSDPMPPLHYVLLHWWRALFGGGDIALRSFSALCSTAALAVFWVLARRVLARPWAVAGALALMGLSVIQVEYAREARYPALLALLGIVMLEGMDRHLRIGSRWAFAQFVVVAAAALYTHTIAAFYLVAIQFAWLIWPRAEDKETSRQRDKESANSPAPCLPVSLSPCLRSLRSLRSLLLADALILVLYAPWFAALKSQLRWMNETGFWDTVPDFARLLWTIAVLAGVKSWYPGRAITWLRGGGWEYSTEIASAVVVLVILATVALVLWRGGRTRSRMAVALAVFALTPVVVLFIQSLIRQPSFVERTLIMSSPALCLLLALPIRRHRPWQIARAAMLAVLLTAAIGSLHGLLAEEHKEDWRSVAQYITSLPDEHRLVIFLGNEGQLPFDHYASRNASQAGRRPYDLTGAPRGFLDLDPPQTMRRIRSDDDLSPLQTRLREGKYRQVVLILRNEPYYDPGGRVRRLLDETHLFSGERRFNKILIRHYTPRAGGFVYSPDGPFARD